MNGYSGFYPRRYLTLLEAVQDFPSDESIDYLKARRVRIMLLHSTTLNAKYSYEEATRRLRQRLDVEFVAEDSQGGERISLFRLKL